MNSSAQTSPSNSNMDTRDIMAKLEEFRVMNEERTKSGTQTDESICPQPCGCFCYAGCFCWVFECIGKTCCYTCCNSYVCGKDGIDIRKDMIVRYCSTCHLLRGHPILPKENKVIENQPRK